MRFLIILAGLALSTSAMAFPTCEVNDRAGSYITTYKKPDEAVKQTLAVGTPVEIMTIAASINDVAWALIREPGQLDTNYGWAVRRLISCQ